MWQSQEFAGALSLGDSVPTEFGTCCADVVPANASADMLLTNVRRCTYFSSVIIPGRLHCMFRLPAAHLYSSVINFATSACDLPPRTKACTRLRKVSALLR